MKIKLPLIMALAFSGLAALTVPVRAADEKPAETKKEETTQRGKRALLQDRMAKVAEELKLTDEQKEKLRPIFHDEAEKMMALRKEDRSDRKAALHKLRDLREDTNAKVKPILTAEQLEKWEKIKDDGLPKRGKK